MMALPLGLTRFNVLTDIHVTWRARACNNGAPLGRQGGGRGTSERKGENERVCVGGGLREGGGGGGGGEAPCRSRDEMME